MVVLKLMQIFNSNLQRFLLFCKILEEWYFRWHRLCNLFLYTLISNSWQEILNILWLEWVSLFGFH